MTRMRGGYGNQRGSRLLLQSGEERGCGGDPHEDDEPDAPSVVWLRDVCGAIFSSSPLPIQDRIQEQVDVSPLVEDSNEQERGCRTPPKREGKSATSRKTCEGSHHGSL